MLGFSGVLGEATLGALELGTLLQGQPFVPHRGAVNSALTAPEAGSTLASPGASSDLSSNSARAEVDDGD